MRLLRRALKVAVKRPAPDTIPRSAPDAETVDCYVARLKDQKAGLTVIVKDTNEWGPVGLAFDGYNYSSQFSIPWANLEGMELEITRFLAHYDFKYSTPGKFLLAQYFQWPHIFRIRDRTQQFLFNRTTLARRERMDALRYLVERTIERRKYASGPIQLMADVYSVRAFFHPDKDELIGYCTLLMDSLVESGDLRNNQGSYSVKPQALVTLAQYDEENRRHRSEVGQQRWIKIFTLALVLTAGIEAWDVASKWPWIVNWPWKWAWPW